MKNLKSFLAMTKNLSSADCCAAKAAATTTVAPISMKLKGLMLAGIKVVKNGDLVNHYSTHSLGGGEWSIEAHEGYDDWSPCIKEWVGSNGTREPADALWKLVDEWAEQVHHKYKLWKAPDGETGSMTFFMREAKRGHLHGCILAL